jgi:TRAP-type mannitol/chloroaromatic compound transport system permease large subunit
VTEFLIANMAPIIFASLVVFLLMGFPVAFSLAANGVIFGLLGIELGLFTPNFFQALPERIFGGVMNNDTLLAIPFFTFMGLVLERSGMAEDLLDTIGQLFGPIRGGLAYAVILVGAMLAATTGVVAASVISMGLISLPIMLRYGYDRRVASGVIAASGTLAQIIPPSLVLIIMADQIGRSVGDMYKGAFIPGFVLACLYMGYVLLVSIFKPAWAPALPIEARTFREPSGRSGNVSLLVLTAISVATAFGFTKWKLADRALDETVVVAMLVGIGTAFVIAVVTQTLKLKLLSQIALRVTFVLIPPLALIFLVLGTIFLGIATPTEGGAMGAVGALLMAIGRKRLSWSLLKQAMDNTAKLTTFVVFILVGARVFSLTFYGVDGHKWVEHLLSDLPGGELGFLIVVNILVFVLAFFLDFFELAFIIVPLLAPVADKLGIDLVWFGVLLAVNMQTSFMHPPFGFALFYLRSVAPTQRYRDVHDGRMLEPVTTGQIYWGAIPFVVIQLIMVSLIIAFPGIVAYDKPQAAGTGPQIDIQQMIQQDRPAGAPGGATPEGSGEQQSDDDLTRSLGGAGAAPAAAGAAAPEAPAQAASAGSGEAPSDADLMKQFGGGAGK